MIKEHESKKLTLEAEISTLANNLNEKVEEFKLFKEVDYKNIIENFNLAKAENEALEVVILIII